MKKVTILQRLVEIPDSDPFEVSITVPPLDVMDQIADLYDNVNAKQKQAALSALSPEAFTYLQKNAHKDRAELMQEAMEKGLVNPQQLLTADGISDTGMARSEKSKVAELISKFVTGLPDDLNDYVERDVLFMCAECVYDYVMDHTANVRAKN